MQPEAAPDRRSVVVAAVLGTAGLAALAACGDDASTASTSVTPTSEDDATPSAAGSTGASAASLVTLDQVPVGGSVVVQGPSGKVAVAQPSAGKVVAFSAICTHQACPVQAAGKRLECPCHGSVFDAFTGQVVQGPAQAPLGKVDVKVSGQDVVAG